MTGDASHVPPRGGRRRLVYNAVAALLVVTGGVVTATAVTAQEGPPPQPAVQAEPTAAPAAVPTPPPSPSATPEAAAGQGISSSPPRPAAPAPVAPPVAVSIPQLQLDEQLITVGLNEDGTIEVPAGENYDRAAWLRISPKPGEVGPAVIEGHVDGADGPSVFYDLGTLVPGDEVTVTRADGTAVTFVVYDIQSHPKDAFPTAAVYGVSQGPELRLITCGGEFSRATGHYLNNIIVFAHLKA